MQQLVQLWHLKSTGGDLVLEKCFWYLIDFQYKGKHWKYKDGKLISANYKFQKMMKH